MGEMFDKIKASTFFAELKNKCTDMTFTPHIIQSDNDTDFQIYDTIA